MASPSPTVPAAFGEPNAERSAALARNWWVLLLRGLIGILLGVLTVLFPGPALASLVLVFAAYMLADGILALVSAVRAARRDERPGWLIVEGLLGIATGGLALLWPGLAVLSFVLLAAAWGIASGIALIVAGLRVHRARGRVLMIVAGAISIAWGALMFGLPAVAALAVVLAFGAYAFAFGVVFVVLALRMRRHRDDALTPA